jgi:hypothetical protein
MKIVELLIDIDNMEFDDDLGVQIMSLVEQPAIGVEWMAFSEEDQFESYSDYPDSVKNNAKRGIELNKENGNKCATQTGKVRAQQLAKGEPISFETIKRMKSYLSRAETYYDPKDPTACGTISYLLWGGKSALSWSTAKIKSIEKERLQALVSQEDFGMTFNSEKDVYIDGTQNEFVDIQDFLKGVIGLDILSKQGLEEKPQIKYRYTGPSAERDFCKAMQRLNKLYEYEELEEMGRRVGNGIDSGANAIIKWKGGPNCRHYFEKVEVYRKGRGPAVIISKGRATEDELGRTMQSRPNGGYNMQWEFSSDDEMIVTGPAMIPDNLILRKDPLGNPFHVFFSKETIKDIAAKFFAYNNTNNTDVNHDDLVTQDNTLLESWIVDDPEMDKSKKLGFENVRSGTWFCSYKINNKETWQKIKAGELNGYSIAGQFLEKAIK